jgi:uncharacterized protein (TIGR03437 family)
MKLSLVALALASFAGAQPFINPGQVLNVSSSQPVLAPNVVFVVYGTNLGPGTIVVAPPPYQTPLAGTSVTFTPVGGGAPVSPKLYFTLVNAVVGVLPSSTTPGTYAVRVTYNNQTSSPQNVTVVARHFGIATANGIGSGLAQADIANVNGGYSLTRFTSSGTPGGTSFVTTPAHANDVIELWGTGGGADPVNDTGGSSGDQKDNFKIILAGQTLTPTYAAAVAGYPGLWLINFTVPPNATPDCFATVQVSANGELSNSANIPIAAAGQTSCTDPLLNQSQLAKMDAGGNLIGGLFSVAKFTNTGVTSIAGQTFTQTAVSESVGGGFGLYTPAEYGARFSQRSVAPCYVFDVTGYAASFPNPGLPLAYPNAGASLPVAGPGLSSTAVMLPVLSGVYLYNLALAPGTLGAGNYSIAGNGGSDIGPFQASLSFPASFTVTNWDNISTVSRAQGFTVNWTGGIATDSVEITLSGQATLSGSSLDPVNQLVHAVTATCFAPASALTFTIPASVMALFPATSFDITSGTLAVLSVAATSSAAAPSKASQFTATASGGGQIDYGYWLYALGFTRNVALN